MTTEELKSAIRRYYSDTTRSREETRKGLAEARDDIEILLETLEDDES